MILDDLTAAVAKRLVEDKAQVSFAEMKERALAAPKKEGFPFEHNLKQKGLSFICEVKKASPSKGLIAPDFPYVAIAKEYEQAGAAAISVLKDFIIDEYQIYEARAIGASAILLICAILDDEQLKRFFKLADSLGLSALVEAHDETEVLRAIKAGARIIGVNNRNLKDFTVSLDTSFRLRTLVPDDIIFVAESGIKTREHTQSLYDHGADAVLIGETLMRSPDKKAALAELAAGTRG